MTDREQLAARIEAAERPTQALFIEAFKVQFGADPMEPGVGKQYRLFLSDGAYLDAAMMLADEPLKGTTLARLLYGAMMDCIANDGDLRKDLARYIAAAAVRAGGARWN